MRPIIDKDGPRLVNDQGETIRGIRAFVVRVNMDDALIVTDVEFIATQDGKPLGCRIAPKQEA